MRFFAKQIRLSGVEQPQVIFYGGEPLLNLPAVKSAMETIETLRSVGDLPAGTQMTLITNGVRVTADIARFLKTHDVTAVVSLDGPEELTSPLRLQGGTRCIGRSCADWRRSRTPVRAWASPARSARRASRASTRSCSGSRQRGFQASGSTSCAPFPRLSVSGLPRGGCRRAHPRIRIADRDRHQRRSHGEEGAGLRGRARRTRSTAPGAETRSWFLRADAGVHGLVVVRPAVNVSAVPRRSGKMKMSYHFFICIDRNSSSRLARPSTWMWDWHFVPLKPEASTFEDVESLRRIRICARGA